MVLLARIYYPEGYNKLWFRSRKFTTLKGITPRHAKGNSFTHNLSHEGKGRRFSWAAEPTYRIPATHPLQCRKPLVNSKQTDLTPSLFEKFLRQRQKEGNLYHDPHISLRTDPRVPQDVTPSKMNN